ncbi:MAG: CDP-alcohol phosphatidyltransferase family protein [Rubricoccaceae bacterium]
MPPSRPEFPGFPDMGRFWTTANLLSLARIALVAPIAWLVYRGGPLPVMLGLIALAVATDWLDGRIARWTDTVSEWGKMLDATADKVAAAAVTLALLTRPPDAGPNLPLWFVLLVILRDAVLAAGGLIQTRRLGHFTSSLWSGKIAVGLLACTVVLALVTAPAPVLGAAVTLTAAVMVFSMASYVVRFHAIWRHGAAALEADGNTLRAPYRRLGVLG